MTDRIDQNKPTQERIIVVVTGKIPEQHEEYRSEEADCNGSQLGDGVTNPYAKKHIYIYYQ